MTSWQFHPSQTQWCAIWYRRFAYPLKYLRLESQFRSHLDHLESRRPNFSGLLEWESIDTFGAHDIWRISFFVLVIAFSPGDIVTFFTGGGQRVCQQSEGIRYWCLWDIRRGVFEVIGELVVIRHRLHSYLPDLTLILLSPRSFSRVPEVGFEAFWLGFPGSWVQSSCEVSYPSYLRQCLRTHCLPLLLQPFFLVLG